jgi:hypothetical protein
LISNWKYGIYGIVTVSFHFSIGRKTQESMALCFVFGFALDGMGAAGSSLGVGPWASLKLGIRHVAANWQQSSMDILLKIGH